MAKSMLMMQSPLESPILLKGRTGDLVVAGYASVEMVDKQGDLITKNAPSQVSSIHRMWMWTHTLASELFLVPGAGFEPASED